MLLPALPAPEVGAVSAQRHTDGVRRRPRSAPPLGRAPCPTSIAPPKEAGFLGWTRGPARLSLPTLNTDVQVATLASPRSPQGARGALRAAVVPRAPLAEDPGYAPPALRFWSSAAPCTALQPGPRLREVPTLAPFGGPEPYTYFVTELHDGVALRATPPRVAGSNAEVRWALDAAGLPLALHTSRRLPTPHARGSRDALERAAYATLHPDARPRRAYLDAQGQRMLTMPLWDTDLFALMALPSADDERRLVGRKLLRDLASDYVRLHARGIAHNDCKPENVLVRHDGTFALTDVDCAFLDRHTAPATWRWAHLATPSYPAPEALERPHAATRAVDIFRLGLCLLSFYGPEDYAAFTDERRPPADYAESYVRAHENLTLLRRLQRQRADEPLRGLPTSRLHRRFGALSWLSAELARLDAPMHTLVFDGMLRERAAERPTAAVLLATATAWLPVGGYDERRARAAVGRTLAALPEVQAQRRDLFFLSQLPPAPAQV